MEGDLQRAVGRNLRALRQARELSQEQFAEAVGVHRTYMGGLERGERNLTLKSVERIASRAGVDPLSLLRDQPSDSFWTQQIEIAVNAEHAHSARRGSATPRG